jgi:hypothetical protein
MRKATSTTDRAGWDISSWCGACGFSRAKYYTLPDDMRPRSLKIGKRHIVIEPPADFLARLAEAQEVA